MTHLLVDMRSLASPHKKNQNFFATEFTQISASTQSVKLISKF